MKLILDNEEDEYIDYYDDYDADGENRTVLNSGFIIHNTSLTFQTTLPREAPQV